MITIENINVKYGDRVVLNNVTTTIGERDRVGLVGRNGAGKSTLLKIVATYQSADSGRVARPNNTTLGFLHQDMILPKGKTVIVETLTAFDHVKAMEEKIADITVALETRTDYESKAYAQLIQDMTDYTEQFQLLGGATMEADAERILGGLGFKSSDMNRLTDEFSGGWQMRIELAKMLLQKPNFLLLDEPTNHLDIESIIWLEAFLKTYEGAVVIISHDKTFLDNTTKRTVEIELGNIYDYKASYTRFKVLQAERREKMAASFKNQQRQIANTERLIEKFRAKANKAKMAQSLIKQLNKVDRIELENENAGVMKVRFLPPPRSGEIVVDVQKMTKNYGQVMVLRDVDFELIRGERISFVGQNGQGKTTLSKIIGSIEGHSKGTVKLGYNVALGYYAQNQAENLEPNSTVLEVLEQNSPEEMRTKLRSILGAFMFSGDDVEKKVKVLSGGERARVALACLMLRPVNLLILDEPTNHLDMASKEVLKQALQEYEGTLIVVSHDRDFLTGLTNRTLEFRDHKLFNHIGDVQAFLEKRKADNMRQIELRQKSSSKKVKRQLTQEELRQQELQQKKLTRAVEKAEKKIEKLEAKIEKIELEMGKPDFYSSPTSSEVLAKYEKSKKELEETMEAWEAAEMALGEL